MVIAYIVWRGSLGPPPPITQRDICFAWHIFFFWVVYDSWGSIITLCGVTPFKVLVYTYVF